MFNVMACYGYIEGEQHLRRSRAVDRAQLPLLHGAPLRPQVYMCEHQLGRTAASGKDISAAAAGATEDEGAAVISGCQYGCISLYGGEH